MSFSSRTPTIVEVLGDGDPGPVRSRGAGPQGALRIDPETLRAAPSGDLFGLTQNAGMGWDPAEAARTPYLVLSTQGGLRAEDGRPIALGYHTGHWEVGRSEPSTSGWSSCPTRTPRAS